MTGTPSWSELQPLTRRALLGLGAGGLAATGIVLLGRPGAPEPAPGTPRPVRHAYGDHPRQVGDLYLPAGPSRGTVVALHGGFWQAGYDLSLQDATSADLADRGWTVWNLDYRSVGDGGGWPTTFDDVRAGVAHLVTVAPEVDEVVLLGHSAGGHLAAWVADEGTGPVRARAAVPLAGVLDLTGAATAGVGGGAVASLLGGSPADVPDRYAAADPTLRVPSAVPVRAVHGREDTVVPPTQSEAYVAAATAAGGDARLVLTPGGHFDALDPASALWTRTVAVLADLDR